MPKKLKNKQCYNVIPCLTSHKVQFKSIKDTSIMLRPVKRRKVHIMH